MLILILNIVNTYSTLHYMLYCTLSYLRLLGSHLETNIYNTTTHINCYFILLYYFYIFISFIHINIKSLKTKQPDSVPLFIA